jgi:hypothetical protein
MARLAYLLMALGVALVAPPCAAAESAASEQPAWPRFELGLDLQGAIALDGGRCRRTESDAIGCSGLGYGLLSVAPGLRVSPWLSVAAVPGLGLSERSTVLQLTAEGRLHPLGVGGFDPSLGLDAGLIGFVDRLPEDEVGPKTQLSHFAATFSALVGFAWQLTDVLALQLNARLRYLAFPAESTFARVSYESTWLGALSLGTTLHW